jgi:hypothetical protein
MVLRPNKLFQFWQEFRQRKVLPFLIGYIAACFAILEFLTNNSERYSIPETTIDLIYILAAIGLPIVIVLPWFINRKRPDAVDELIPELKSAAMDEKKVLHNLPLRLTTFIGRQMEMETVRELIGEHRIVSLTGPGGCGKTRLACEVASQLVPDFKDGVWFIDLAPIASGDSAGCGTSGQSHEAYECSNDSGTVLRPV